MKILPHPTTRKLWIIPEPTDPPVLEPMGPYANTRDGKKDAESDMRGVKRLLENEGKRGFVTSGK